MDNRPRTTDRQSPLTFEILAEEGDARAGRLTTPHGVIETPAFVPVATWAAVTSLSMEDVQSIGAQVLIANAYHLHLQPGEDVIHRAGGLHRFMGWGGPLMTDSGGFQIFSLGAGKEHGVGKMAPIFPGKKAGRQRGPVGKSLVKMDEDGAEFISFLDGTVHRFSPETVMEIERKLGADMIFILDECTSPLHDLAYTRTAMERTHRWALRAMDQHRKNRVNDQAIFGIVQGGAFRDLRKESARFMASLDFDGYAVGGSLGKSKEEMYKVLEWVVPFLPANRPRHLLGIGTVDDIFQVVDRGIDLFDCVAPTLLARTGTVFAKDEEGFRIHLFNARFREDGGPIEDGCACPACTRYSRGYLRHLFIAKEQTAVRLAALHNLHFMEEMMREIRAGIREGRLGSLKKRWMG